MQNEHVEPGTPLAYSEELLPGDCTYDDGEQIRAAAFGTTQVDADTMTISVHPDGGKVANVEKGDIIIGRVSYAKPELASVAILAIRGKEGRTTLHNVEATLHVSKVDNRYISDMQTEVRVGDLIRAKVLGLKGGPQLAVDKPDLGVIRAFSPDDLRRPMIKKAANRVQDPETGKIYARKLADDYGSGLV